MTTTLPIISNGDLLPHSTDETRYPKPFLKEVEGIVERALASCSFDDRQGQAAYRANSDRPGSSARKNSIKLRKWLVSTRIQRQTEWNALTNARLPLTF